MASRPPSGRSTHRAPAWVAILEWAKAGQGLAYSAAVTALVLKNGEGLARWVQ